MSFFQLILLIFVVQGILTLTPRQKYCEKVSKSDLGIVHSVNLRTCFLKTIKRPFHFCIKSQNDGTGFVSGSCELKILFTDD